MAYKDHQAEYRKIGRAAAKFAEMVADFERMGTGEFTKLYPDYDIEGTGYICRHAETLAEKLNAYASQNLSGMGRAARKAA